ncbi:hypothetical protein FCULG_00006906 [Fusarium culmorum]|uniref:Integral membrane protein n=1 Tax=Fusarium culmorum TaxID=5516 RepID=A0A2T4GTZ8_FUSCU|nr:hypothetical protein FCULG_00006906 [Fusarium culmorum]
MTTELKRGGILIPPWFEYHQPSCSDWAIVSIVFGMTLCLTLFGLIRVSIQTYNQWKRAQRITTYMILIWLELIASGVIGGLGWGYVRGTIRPGLFLWVFQIHCIMQIIVNRIALLHVSPTIVRRLKWGIFSILALINISVFCIWIPARLQISQTYIDINNVWDRIEKGIFAVIDLALNFYFVYLVRSSLIAYGLKKYVVLYRFNLIMVVISISMDLHIELSMAELIAKIVKASGPNLTPCRCACHDDTNHIFLHPMQSRHSAPAATSLTFPTTGRLRRSWPAFTKNIHNREKRRGVGRLMSLKSTRKNLSREKQTAKDNKPQQEAWKSDTNVLGYCGSQSMPSSAEQTTKESHSHND